MKLKTYKATFWRGNPQLKDGGYKTVKTIQAVSIASARKKAREYESWCSYGTMKLLKIEKEV